MKKNKTISAASRWVAVAVKKKWQLEVGSGSHLGRAKGTRALLPGHYAAAGAPRGFSFFERQRPSRANLAAKEGWGSFAREGGLGQSELKSALSASARARGQLSQHGGRRGRRRRAEKRRFAICFSVVGGDSRICGGFSC